MHYYCNTQHFSGKEEVVWGWGFDISKYHITNIKTVIKPRSASHRAQNTGQAGPGDIKHQTETLIDVSEWVMSASHGGFWQSSIQNLSELVINYDGEGRTARGRARETAALPRQRNKWLVCFYNSICCCSNMHVLIAATEAMQPIHGTFASVSGPL